MVSETFTSNISNFNDVPSPLLPPFNVAAIKINKNETYSGINATLKQVGGEIVWHLVFFHTLDQ